MKIITHNGKHHLDEVMTIAAEQLRVNWKVKVVRLPAVTEEAIENEKPHAIFDIKIEGKEKCLGKVNLLHIDHHGKEDDQHCTFWQWWEMFGMDLLGMTKFEYAYPPGAMTDMFYLVKDLLVTQIDLRDRGLLDSKALARDTGYTVRSTHFADFINLMEFEFAVECCEKLLQKTIQYAAEKIRSDHMLQRCEIRHGILIMKEFLPWKEWAFRHPDVVFGLAPGRGDEWCGLTVRLPGQKTKKEFPQEWLTTPPPGITFVHNGLFMISGSRKSVLAALKSLI